MANMITADTPAFTLARNRLKKGKFNGAYFYAKEIEQNIVPRVKTNRPWDLLGKYSTGSFDNAIVFLHNNAEHEKVYGSWLGKFYKNQIFIVNQPCTLRYVESKGLPCIYLPVSVDLDYVKQFRTKKTKKACYVGNRWNWRLADIEKYVPKDVDYAPDDMERDDLLRFMAQYEICYAVSRCAVEAKALGCQVMKCHSELDPDDFPMLDNKDAAVILQRELDKYERSQKGNNNLTS